MSGQMQMSLKELLESKRLGKFTPELVKLGVVCPEDLQDVEPDDLDNMHMTKIEKNRFQKLVTEFGQSTASASPSMGAHWSASPSPVSQSMPRSQAGIERVETFLRIRVFSPVFNAQDVTLTKDKITQLSIPDVCEHLRGVFMREYEVTAELYAPEGYPLQQTGTQLTCSLVDLGYDVGDLLYAFFRVRDVGQASRLPKSEAALDPTKGSLQIFVKPNMAPTITVNVDITDTGLMLKRKTYFKTKTPTSIQRLSYGGRMIGDHQCLSELGIQYGSTVIMWVAMFTSGFPAASSWPENFCTSLAKPVEEQTVAGQSCFNAVLYVVCDHIQQETASRNALLDTIFRLTQCPPLLVALDSIFRRRIISSSHKVAINEGLYALFREIVPRDQNKVPRGVKVFDNHVFEHSPLCWAYLLSEAKDEKSIFGSFEQTYLTCSASHTRMESPVRVPGCDSVFDRTSVLNAIQESKVLPGCSSIPSEETLMHVPFIHRLLLSFPPSARECFIWNGASDFAKNRVAAPSPPNFRFSWADLENKRKSLRILRLVPSLALKTTSGACLTLNKDGHVVVFTGKSKDVNKSAYIFSPLAGTTTSENPDVLAVSTNAYSNLFSSSQAKTDEKMSRDPKEAIVVLLDVSSSMNEKCFDGSMIRLNAVKELFHAFANRSMAYDHPHVIGLTLFGTTVAVASEVTELFESFKAEVDAATSSGMTRLYDALLNAAGQLNLFTQSHPTCRKRIFCLTDGDDTKSRSAPLDVAKKMQESDIVIDAVLVGPGNAVLKSLAVASRGCCFYPADLATGFKLFEMETVLSLEERVLPEKVNVSTAFDLKRLEDIQVFPYDTSPRHRRPEELSKPVISAKRALHDAAVAPPQGGPASAPARTRRILREMADYYRHPHPSVEIYPCEDRIDFWRMLLVGPEDTPYSNGVFILYAKFLAEYPSKSPEIRFVTQIYHCNINSSGRVCHSVFDRNYTTDTSFRTIIDCIYGLLLEPEPEDPLDSILAAKYFSSRAEYDTQATETTRKFASRSLEDCRKDLIGTSDLDADDDAPQHLKCPLTGKLFIDPVIVPSSGNTYERTAIEAHLHCGTGRDPVSNDVASVSNLIVNKGMRDAVASYKKQLSQASQWWQ
ncbi:uncharacterized protein [Oscarella lobularis]|uniref:uncharacterized protein isoform X1 n=2 Tax=Oscarella lobularis TaxID=121494 RepID=UPI003313A189